MIAALCSLGVTRSIAVLGNGRLAALWLRACLCSVKWAETRAFVTDAHLGNAGHTDMSVCSLSATLGVYVFGQGSHLKV